MQNTVPICIWEAFVTLVKTQISQPGISQVTAPVISVNTPVTQNTQIGNNLSIKLGITNSENVNLVSQVVEGKQSQVVTLGELKTQNDSVSVGEIRVSLGNGSLVSLVNGGVTLPSGVEQQFYVVREEMNINASTNQNNETIKEKTKGTN